MLIKCCIPDLLQRATGMNCVLVDTPELDSNCCYIYDNVMQFLVANEHDEEPRRTKMFRHLYDIVMRNGVV